MLLMNGNPVGTVIKAWPLSQSPLVTPLESPKFGPNGYSNDDVIESDSGKSSANENYENLKIQIHVISYR